MTYIRLLIIPEHHSIKHIPWQSNPLQTSEVLLLLLEKLSYKQRMVGTPEVLTILLRLLSFGSLLLNEAGDGA